MRALLIYESMFGDTKAIADAISLGLSSRMTVEMVEVGVAPTEVDAAVDLLVVGGPTHAFGMSRPWTRQDADRQAPGKTISTLRGLREWLDSADLPTGLAAAAFDTRMGRLLSGSAGRAAEKVLHRKGCRIAEPAADFFVTGTQGPLRDGELARAGAWGASLAAAVVDGANTRTTR